MIALYKIADEYRQALDIDVDTELDAQALADLLGEVEARFEDKAAQVVGYWRNMEAEAEAYKAEADRLVERARVIRRRGDAVREYLALEMRRVGMAECRAGTSTLKFVKNPWAVEVEDVGRLPDEYLRHKPPEPDKTKIAEALKAGVQVDGARLVQSERLKIS